MGKLTKLEPGFNEAAGALPQTDFANSLQLTFDKDTARKVLKTFELIGLPAPEKGEEYFGAAEGVLVFLNRYGVVIRIERPFDRINDSPWILSPLASIQAGMTIIEICPGCHFEPDEANVDNLRKHLGNQGIDFWDCMTRNVGRIPVRIFGFPEGIPVVIDRPSVRRRLESIVSVCQALKDESEKATETVERLYAPLRDCFNDGWLQAQKIEGFWDMCRRYVQEGKLIAGWNDEGATHVLYEKASKAANRAAAYEARLQLTDHPVNSTAPAVPRSPRRPV